MTLRTLNYGNYGIFLIMGHAGFCPSTVVLWNSIVCLPAGSLLHFHHRRAAEGLVRLEAPKRASEGQTVRVIVTVIVTNCHRKVRKGIVIGNR